MGSSVPPLFEMIFKQAEDQSTDSIRDWAKKLVANTQEGFNDKMRARFTKFADVIGNCSGYVGDATPDTFWDAMLCARKRDRDQIRNWYRAIHKNIYCAEYGVAQSESYNGNREAAGAGGLGIDPGLAQEGTGPRRPGFSLGAVPQLALRRSSVP